MRAEHRSVAFESTDKHAAVFKRVRAVAVLLIRVPVAVVGRTVGVGEPAVALSHPRRERTAVGVVRVEPGVERGVERVRLRLVRQNAVPRMRPDAVGFAVDPFAAVRLTRRGPTHDASAVLLVARPPALVPVTRGVLHPTLTVLPVVAPLAFVPRVAVGVEGERADPVPHPVLPLAVVRDAPVGERLDAAAVPQASAHLARVRRAVWPRVFTDPRRHVVHEVPFVHDAVDPLVPSRAGHLSLGEAALVPMPRAEVRHAVTLVVSRPRYVADVLVDADRHHGRLHDAARLRHGALVRRPRAFLIWTGFDQRLAQNSGRGKFQSAPSGLARGRTSRAESGSRPVARWISGGKNWRRGCIRSSWSSRASSRSSRAT